MGEKPIVAKAKVPVKDKTGSYIKIILVLSQ
jgi:hypothetical protein